MDEIGDDRFTENDDAVSAENLEAAQDVVENEVDKLAEESSVSPAGMEGENAPPISDDQDDGTVDDGVNDHRLSTEKPKKDVPEEVPIKYLKSPVNGRVFPVSKDLIRRKDLIPCDEDGKKIYDHRKIGRFS